MPDVVVWCRIQIWYNSLYGDEIDERLWFDVESKYDTTQAIFIRYSIQLWFDVESKYDTTTIKNLLTTPRLWFDVESKYDTTRSFYRSIHDGCGLM